MIDNLNALISEIKTHLAADETFPPDTVVDVLQHPVDFPAMDRYALVISPKRISFALTHNRVIQETNTLDAAAIVTNFDPALSITGDAPGEVGLIRFVYLLRESLTRFFEAHKESLDVTYTETGDADLTAGPSERKGFYREAVIPLTVKYKINKFVKL
jgi:hypothetical protein